jgi:hypothetical protein
MLKAGAVSSQSRRGKLKIEEYVNGEDRGTLKLEEMSRSISSTSQKVSFVKKKSKRKAQSRCGELRRDSSERGLV